MKSLLLFLTFFTATTNFAYAASIVPQPDPELETLKGLYKTANDKLNIEISRLQALPTKTPEDNKNLEKALLQKKQAALFISAPESKANYAGAYYIIATGRPAGLTQNYTCSAPLVSGHKNVPIYGIGRTNSWRMIWNSTSQKNPQEAR